MTSEEREKMLQHCEWLIRSANETAPAFLIAREMQKRLLEEKNDVKNSSKTSIQKLLDDHTSLDEPTKKVLADNLAKHFTTLAQNDDDYKKLNYLLRETKNDVSRLRGNMTFIANISGASVG